MATSKLPRSFNSLDISSMWSVQSEVTGRDKFKMATKNQKSIYYYVGVAVGISLLSCIQAEVFVIANVLQVNGGHL